MKTLQGKTRNYKVLIEKENKAIALKAINQVKAFETEVNIVEFKSVLEIYCEINSSRINKLINLFENKELWFDIRRVKSFNPNNRKFKRMVEDENTSICEKIQDIIIQNSYQRAFQLLGNLSINNNQKHLYYQLQQEFISGTKDFNFNERLRTFADSVCQDSLS